MLSVPKSRAQWFILLFVLQFLGTLGLVIYQEVVGNTSDSALETALAIGKGFSPFVIIIIATTVITVEGVAMLYDLYKREVEERTSRRNKEEMLRLSQEWEKLSQEEQRQQGITEFLRNKWPEPDKKK
jgi:flagellar basal body-associated protein FliL